MHFKRLVIWQENVIEITFLVINILVDGRKLLTEHNAIPALLNVLKEVFDKKSDDQVSKLQSLTMRGLLNLCFDNAKNVETILNSDVVDVIAAVKNFLSQDESAELKRNTIATVANFCHSDGEYFCFYKDNMCRFYSITFYEKWCCYNAFKST